MGNDGTELLWHDGETRDGADTGAISRYEKLVSMFAELMDVGCAGIFVDAFV